MILFILMHDPYYLLIARFLSITFSEFLLIRFYRTCNSSILVSASQHSHLLCTSFIKLLWSFLIICLYCALLIDFASLFFIFLNFTLYILKFILFKPYFLINIYFCEIVCHWDKGCGRGIFCSRNRFHSLLYILFPFLIDPFKHSFIDIKSG